MGMVANNNQDQRVDFGQNYTLSLSLFHLSVIIRKTECLKYLLEKNLSIDLWLEPLHFQSHICIPPTTWSGHGSDILMDFKNMKNTVNSRSPKILSTTSQKYPI